MNIDTKYLLDRASAEIKSLRRANEILGAKVETMELFAQVLRSHPRQQSHGMAEDIAWQIDEMLRKSNTCVGTIEDVVAVMGRDVPMVLDGQTADVPWVKRLRERTGCTLKDAKDAHDMMLAHARTRDADVKV